MEQRTETENS